MLSLGNEQTIALKGRQLPGDAWAVATRGYLIEPLAPPTVLPGHCLPSVTTELLCPVAQTSIALPTLYIKLEEIEAVQAKQLPALQCFLLFPIADFEDCPC